MGRLLMVLGMLACLLAVPVAAQAGTTVQKIPFVDDELLCNRDTVHIEGTLNAVISETTTPSGGNMIAFHFNPQGVTGVDLQTGDVFHANGVTRDVLVTTPPGGSVETFINRFHIQAVGGVQSLIITEVFHATVAPDGTVTVFLDKMSATC